MRYDRQFETLFLLRKRDAMIKWCKLEIRNKLKRPWEIKQKGKDCPEHGANLANVVKIAKGE